jgi:hypothetical protein
MDWIEDISRQWKSGQKLSNDAGEIICERCNGTGIDPDYKEVNAVLVAIDELFKDNNTPPTVNHTNHEVPYCLKCYGMKKLDWIQYAQGIFRQELDNRRRRMRERFLSDVLPFLIYVDLGGAYFKVGHPIKYMQFDLKTKSWVEVRHRNGDTNSMRNAFKWLHRFRDEGYFDLEIGDDNFPKYPTLFWYRVERHLTKIKTELLRSAELTMERLKEIKNDLDLFWVEIETLAKIEIEEVGNERLSTEFEFTWESILRRFGLPLSHLALLNPEKSKAEK